MPALRLALINKRVFNMQAIILVFVCLLSLAVIAGSLLGIVYILAKNNIMFTFVPTGEMKMIDRGESFCEMLINVPGKTYDPVNDVIIDGKPKLRWFTERFGIMWVGILFRRVHVYDFEYDELEATTDPMTKQVRYTMAHRAYKGENAVDSAYWKSVYAILSNDIKIIGNFQLQILMNVTLEIVKPLYLIYILKGNWMPFAVSAISGLDETYSKEKNLEQFRAAVNDEKTSGSLAKFLTTNGVDVRSILAGAVKIVHAEFVAYDLSGSSGEILKASTAIEVAKLEAQATIEEGKGEAGKILAIGTAEADVIKLKGKAEGEAITAEFAAVGTNPNGASMYSALKMSEAIQGAQTKVVTFGGQGPLISVPIETVSK